MSTATLTQVTPSPAASEPVPPMNRRPSQKVPLPRVTIAEYLAAERVALVRHEYIKGAVREMPGGTFEHGLITMNIGIALGNALEHLDYSVLSGDVQVYIERGVFYYADVSVVGGKPEIDFEEAIRNPVIVVEVLSSSTEQFDHSEKFQNYRKIPALRHYILVSQERPFVEHWWKNDQDVWTLAGEYEGLDAEVTLPGIGATLPLRRIYRRVSFPNLEAEDEETTS